MNEMNFYHKHYIRIREDGCIVDGFSDAFREPKDTDICINEKGGYQFRLFPGGEENPCLFDWPDRIPLYKYENGEVLRRSEEEIEAERAAIVRPVPPPTDKERITALEEALEQTDEAAIALYEAHAEQEAINAAQDEALIEIYEMMEG